MELSNIKVLDVHLKKDDDAKRRKEAVVCVIRPHWRCEDILEEIDEMGYLNKSFIYSLKSDDQKTDAIVLRVFGEFLAVTDRDMEIASMQYTHLAGYFPPVLAVFSNGVAYKYVHGKMLTGEDLLDPTFIRTSARGLAKLHGVDVDKIDVIGRDGQKYTLSEEESDYITRFLWVIEAYPAQLSDPDMEAERIQKKIPSVDYVREELQNLKSLMHRLGFSRSPLCHGDFHGSNILYDKKSSSCTFLDLELSGSNFVAYDIAYLYGIYIVPFFGITHLEGPVSDDTLRVFVTSYLTTKHELQGDDGGDVHENEIRLLMLEVRIITMAVSLCFAIIGYFFMAYRPGEIDAAREILDGLREYEKLKPHLQNLLDEYTKIKDLSHQHM